MSIGGLVERVVELALNETTPEIKTLVGHRFPDDDVWLCYWIARRWIPKADKADIVFVNAGETLPGSEGDPTVLHFDTGRGKYDQHNKSLKGTCSAALLAKELGLNDPGLKPLIDMVTAVDNVEPLSPISLHYAIEGYPRRFKNPDGTIDWKKVQERVFELFEIMYGQETSRAEARAKLPTNSRWRTLPNGLRVAWLLWHPGLRDAAFEKSGKEGTPNRDKGASVVVWTQPQKKKGLYVGVQRNRDYPELRLDKVVAAIRASEAHARNISAEGGGLDCVDKWEGLPGWFLHDSLALILSGSPKWELKPEEFTKLSPSRIVDIVCNALGKISTRVVASWEKDR